MAINVPTSNAGTTYFNINRCRTFRQGLAGGNPATVLTNLTGAANGAAASALSGQPCSSIFIQNVGGVPIYIADHNFQAIPNRTTIDSVSGFAMTLSAGESATLLGLTNVMEVSAAGVGAAGHIVYRAQYFDSNPAH